MRKSVFVFLFFLLSYLSILESQAFAIVDPLAVPNNRFGIHIVDGNDLDDAAKLLNSTNGAWGYVAMVIRSDERNHDKWQAVFDRMRKLRLIPIIRLATVAENGVWKKPRVEDIDEWANFLHSLNWVVKNRYVILFNEPNHASEWGGEIKPDEYALLAHAFRNKLKNKSPDFFILPAGLDEATPTTNDAMEAAEYLRRMVLADSDIFTIFDGLTTHSYPNPNFSGSPYASGRTTIKSYVWLDSYLRTYKLPSDLPIFITETGWIHREGGNSANYLHTADEVASYFTTAFNDIWTEKRIVAITPFILNYQDAPFDHFSWKAFGQSSFYPQYDALMRLSKVKGEPEQEVRGIIDINQIPAKLTTDFLYLLPIRIKNTGQRIWDDEHAATLNIISNNGSVSTLHITDLAPLHETVVKLPFKTPSDAQTVRLAFQLFANDKQISDMVNKEVEVAPPTSIWSKMVRLLRSFIPRKLFTAWAVGVTQSSHSTVAE